MCASVVLPRPGGPNSSTWSSASERRLRGLDEDFQLAADLFLADVFVELARAQRALERFLVRRDGRGRDDAFGGEFVGFDHASIVPRGRRETGRTAMVRGRAWSCIRRMRRSRYLRQRLQRELDAFGNAGARRHVLDRRQRFLFGVTECQQCIQDIGSRDPAPAPRPPPRRDPRRACPSVRAAGAPPSSCRCPACASGAPASCMRDRLRQFAARSCRTAPRAPCARRSPVILSSSRKVVRSCGVPKPYSRCASSRTIKCVSNTTFSPVCGRL